MALPLSEEPPVKEVDFFPLRWYNAIMNYSRKQLDQKIENITGQEKRQKNRFRMFLVTVFLAFLVYLALVGLSVAAGSVTEILKNTPAVSSVEQLRPSETKSIIYAADGSIIQELIQSGSNRETVTYDQIPTDLIYAFVAREDARFFDHEGIDLKGILRAVFSALTSGNLSQGASTITQQLIKNSIFEGGYETNFGDRIERKLQEQYLAIRVEKELDKKTIMQHYLNTINLGANTLGVQVASQRYFGKNVSDLDLAECTVLAAITKNPTRLNPITHPEENQVRRLLVLKDMLHQGYINDDQYDEACKEDVYARIQLISQDRSSEQHAFSWFTDTVYQQVNEALQEQLGYSDTQAYHALYSGGLRIYTTQDPKIQKIMDEELNNEANYIVTNADGTITNYYEYALSYRLCIRLKNGEEYHYNENSILDYFRDTLGNTVFKLTFDTEDALREAVVTFRDYIVSYLDAEVVSESISSTVQPQASCILIDQKTGYVLAVTGGRGNKDDIGSLVLNRAVDSTRQPGSCFKILTAYAPALDISGATLAKTYYDSQLLIDNRSIANWWGYNYLGYATIRSAIQASMNIVAVKCLEQTVSEDVGFSYAKDFGITSLIPEDKTPLLPLGSIAYGVSNLELTAAYASIANNGIYTEPIFWTQVTDADGRIILENKQKTKPILKESTAKLLTSAMESSVYPEFTLWPDQGVSATSMDCQVEGQAVAGKSGTTNDANDIWFVGYTPYYTMGIWSGYDAAKSFGVSPGYHKKMWANIMQRIHEGLPSSSFDYSGLEKAVICSKSGLLAREGVCGSTGDPSCHIYEEYFAPGTAPMEYCDCHASYRLCTLSGRLAGEYCPEDMCVYHSFIQIKPEDNDGIETVDTWYTLPPSYTEVCGIHTEAEPETSSEEEDTTSESDTEDTGTEDETDPENDSGSDDNVTDDEPGPDENDTENDTGPEENPAPEDMEPPNGDEIPPEENGGNAEEPPSDIHESDEENPA